MEKKPHLGVNIGGVTLTNPVMTASGTFGYAREFEHLLDLNRLGAIIVKGLSLEPVGASHAHSGRSVSSRRRWARRSLAKFRF